MNLNNLVTIVLCLVFVTKGESVMKDDQENEIVSRQIETCDNYPQIKCSDDCTSLRVCYAETAPPLRLKCPADKPYCSNGHCGTVNSCQLKPNIDANVLSFQCTSDGIFPDPANCTNRYECVGSTATKVSCSAGYIFDSKINLCVRGTPRIDHASKRICRKISCDNKPNGYILFPANPAFYAYCSNNSMILYKCDDVQNQAFDISSNKCVFNCRSEGYFPNPLNCTVYYLCKGLIKLRPITLHCAWGHYFDGTKCINGQNCGTTTTTETPSPPTPTPTVEPSTEEPSTTVTESPTTITEQPTPPPTEPPTSTEDLPTTVTESPTTITEQPTPPPTEPPTSTEEPSTTVTESSTTITEQPTPPPTEPPTSTEEPSTTVTESPTTITEQPTPPPTEPPTSTEDPSTTVTESPTTITEQPTPPPTEPPTSTEEPSTTVTESPTTITEQPTPPSTEPPTSTEDPPTTVTESPTTITEQPTPTTEPPTSTEEPSTTVTDSTTTVTEPSTVTEDPSTIATELPTTITEPPTDLTSTIPFVSPAFIAHDSLALITLPAHQGLIDIPKTTKSPTYHQSSTIWKHKGKYSVRLS